jgi:hypothetical protein
MVRQRASSPALRVCDDDGIAAHGSTLHLAALTWPTPVGQDDEEPTAVGAAITR